MTKQQQIQQAARLWLSESDRDVAEIRLDDLLNPTAEDAIVEIHGGGFVERPIVTVVQESGTVTRIAV